MNCSLCSQKISQGKANDFYGDTLCGNCHRRLRVGQLPAEQLEDTFLPVLVREGDPRDRMKALSMRSAYVARRGLRSSSASILIALHDRYREGRADALGATGLALAARTLALYGADAGKGLAESETKYLLSLSREEAELLEAEWSSEGRQVERRFQVLRAFLGVVLRAEPSAEELCARILMYERAGSRE